MLLLWVWAKAAQRVAGDIGRSPRMELLDIVSESSDQFEGAVKQIHVKAGKTIRDSVSTATVLAGIVIQTFASHVGHKPGETAQYLSPPRRSQVRAATQKRVCVLQLLLNSDEQ